MMGVFAVPEQFSALPDPSDGRVKEAVKSYMKKKLSRTLEPVFIQDEGEVYIGTIYDEGLIPVVLSDPERNKRIRECMKKIKLLYSFVDKLISQGIEEFFSQKEYKPPYPFNLSIPAMPMEKVVEGLMRNDSRVLRYVTESLATEETVEKAG